AYLETVHDVDQAYNGFNLIVGDASQAWYLSNRDGGPRALAPGVYALSNNLLDTPWPKLARTKSAFTAVLHHQPQPDLPALFAALAVGGQAGGGQVCIVCRAAVGER
ncbi:NRDE family protein, partial [Paenibacillus polymyxa]|nr:NRDE family protein [Paenibacillus polymyxa]